jgi:drug/metabolite transporter (DMT)-like permease
MPSVSASAPTRGGLAVLIALSLVYVVWGSTYLAIRFALEGGFPPLLMAGIRFLVAGALMYAVLRLRHGRADSRAVGLQR